MGAGTYYGVQYSKAYVADPPTMIHASYFGKTLTMMDTQDALTATGLDAGSTFAMFRPPKGARWNGIGKLWTDDLGTACHVSVGTGITGAAVAAVVDKFFPATEAHSGPYAFILGAATEIDAVGYEFDGQTDVIVTTSSGAMDDADTVTLMMQFAVA